MKMTRLLVAAALVCAVLIISIPQSSAQTMYACVNNKNGAMYYATAPNQCSKSETQISWNVTGPAGPPGSGFQVFDANNKLEGNVVGVRQYETEGLGGNQIFRIGPHLPYVAINLNSSIYMLQVQRNFLRGSHFLFYESTNCSGQPYITWSSSAYIAEVVDAGPMRNVAVAPPAVTIYVENGSDSYVNLTIRSMILSDGTCRTDVAYSGPLVPAVSLATFNFTGPFTVRQVP